MPPMRMANLARVVAVLLGLAAVVACRPGDPQPRPDETAPPGTSTWTLTVDGEQRSYLLYRPAALPDPAPLVLMLHGGLGTADHAQQHYGWDAAADANGFVVAYPQGIGRTWAAGGGCCGRAAREDIDDVAFLTALVADAGRRVAVDPDRVYATGMSNGAMMSYRLACDTNLFAAIAPVAGTLLGECPGPAPISVLHIHGLADESVRFDGAPGTGPGRIDGPDVPSMMDTWRTAAGCSPPQTRSDGVVTTVRSECPQGRSVVLVTVADAGHQWPGSTISRAQQAFDADPPSTAFVATTVIADFFAAHPRVG